MKLPAWSTGPSHLHLLPGATCRVPPFLLRPGSLFAGSRTPPVASRTSFPQLFPRFAAVAERSDVVKVERLQQTLAPRGGEDRAPTSVAEMVAPRLWSALELIGFLPREQLTWIKALDPEDIVTSTAWGSWRSATRRK